MFLRNASLFFLTFLASFCIGAQEDDYGQKGDVYLNGCGMALTGNILYMSSGSASFSKSKALVAVDISKATEPKLLCSLPLKGFPQDIAISGKNVLIVDGLRLSVIDAGNPSELKLLSELLLDESPMKGPQGVAVQGNYAFLACRTAGLKVVDISNATSPKTVGSCQTTGFARGVALKEHFAYMADDTKGITVIDIANPSKPVKTRTYPIDCGTAAKLRINENILFLANGFTPLESYSMSDGGKLEHIGALRALRNMQYYGTYCYDLALDGANPAKYAYLAAGESGVVSVDISDPKKPRLLGNCKEILYTGIKTLVLNGTLVYASDEGNRLIILNVSNPENPKLIGEPLILSK
ncbi:MAG: hypothetical protein A2X49_14250 [Lentisphaerae bacterium GWF2_52_8]|nr:MAG: hypothetical protein A2X49_14250 [Lentisphaerae bacterium GWF2_52_8]